MSEAATPDTVATATLFGGRLLLRQFARGHRAGTDAVLLAAAADLGAGERFIDAGAGPGAVGLWLGLRTQAAHGVLLETDRDAAALARENVVANGLDRSVDVAELDLFDRDGCRRAGLDGSADLVVSNPPFYAAGSVRASPDASRARAHVAEARQDDPHAAWLARCAALLGSRGRLVVIHRPDAVPALLRGLPRRFGGVTLLPVHPKPGQPAIRVLFGAVAGSRAPLTVMPGLTLHGDDGAFTPMAQAVHDGAQLPFWPATLGRPRAGRDRGTSSSANRPVTPAVSRQSDDAQIRLAD